MLSQNVGGTLNLHRVVGRGDLSLRWERASRDGDLVILGQALERGHNIDARDRYGQTALMRAAHFGRADAVWFLIGQGADLDRIARYGLSALMLAAISGQKEAAELLIEAGADVTTVSPGTAGLAGQTAADFAEARGDRELATKIRAAANRVRTTAPIGEVRAANVAATRLSRRGAASL